MRRVFFTIVSIALVLAACSPAVATERGPENDEQATSTAGGPTEEPAQSPTGESPPPGEVEKAVIEQLAGNLGLDTDDISLVSSEEEEFADACLGVTMEGVMCAEVITPGRIIVLEADGVQYEYHTSEDGSRVQPASVAMIWKREGGIAGFCDTLMVFRSGEVYANRCKPDSEGTMGTIAQLLSASEQTQFMKWMSGYGDVELDASDPKGVADRMVVTIELHGWGKKQPTEAEQQTLMDFAQNLYQEVMK